MSQIPVTQSNDSGHNEPEEPAERRRHRRVARTARFSFYPLDEWGDKSYPASAVDVSAGGLSFISNRRVEEGSLIVITLRILDVLAGEERAKDTAGVNGNRITAAARVKRVERQPDGQCKVAVRFDFETHMEGDKNDLKIIFARS
jgi:hypothetical protein